MNNIRRNNGIKLLTLVAVGLIVVGFLVLRYRQCNVVQGGNINMVDGKIHIQLTSDERSQSVTVVLYNNTLNSRRTEGLLQIGAAESLVEFIFPEAGSSNPADRKDRKSGAMRAIFSPDDLRIYFPPAGAIGQRYYLGDIGAIYRRSGCLLMAANFSDSRMKINITSNKVRVCLPSQKERTRANAPFSHR